jgi:hypothetical protein
MYIYTHTYKHTLTHIPYIECAVLDLYILYNSKTAHSIKRRMTEPSSAAPAVSPRTQKFTQLAHKQRELQQVCVYVCLVCVRESLLDIDMYHYVGVLVLNLSLFDIVVYDYACVRLLSLIVNNAMCVHIYMRIHCGVEVTESSACASSY